MKVLCISILVIVLLYILLKYYRRNTEQFTFEQTERMYKYLPLEYYYCDKIYTDKLVKMAKTVFSILNKHNIRYWSIFGTLLGVVRHKGVIPWDDDIDIAFDVEELDKLYSLKDEFNKYGMILSKIDTDKRIVYKLRYSKKDPELKKQLWIDLFPYEKRQNYWHRVKGQYTPIRDTDLLPLQQSLFHGLSVNVPNNSNAVLDESYGDDWETNAVVSIHQKVLGNHHYIRTHKMTVPIGDISKHMWK